MIAPAALINIFKLLQLYFRFKSYFRVTIEQFQELTLILNNHYARAGKPSPRARRDSLSTKEKLAICLRFLRNGSNYDVLASAFRVGQSTVCCIVREVCGILWKELQPLYMKCPDTEEEWKKISQEFYTKWNFPNCIGSLDGKHVTIIAPPRSGSMFFNHKGTYSIVLLALVDADRKFLCIDVGSYGKNADSGIFENSAMYRAFENGSLNLPDDDYLPDGEDLGKMPYVVVGDEAFPLKNYIMRPCPGKQLTEDKIIYN